MFKCRISGVRKKKEIERKVPGKKMFFALHKKNEVKKFAKFAFTWLGFRLIYGEKW